MIAARRFPPPGQLVDAGGFRMHLQCEGEGRPVLVFDSGIGAASFEWAHVTPALRKITRVCTYDRAGYGWSERGPDPRTSAIIADEFYRMTVAASLPPPYVLVGHSFGGFNMRIFASRHPDRVAALVLLESLEENELAEGTTSYSRTMLLARVFAPFGLPRLVRGYFTEQNLPPETQAAADALRPRTDAYVASYQERTHLRESADEVKKALLPRRLRLVVLSRAAKDVSWDLAQARLVKLTTNSSHAASSVYHHYPQIFDQTFFLRAIEALFQELRTAHESPAPRVY